MSWFWKEPVKPVYRRENIGGATTIEDACLNVSKQAAGAEAITRFVWNGFDSYAYPNESPQQVYNRLDGIIMDAITAGVM